VASLTITWYYRIAPQQSTVIRFSYHKVQIPKFFYALAASRQLIDAITKDTVKPIQFRSCLISYGYADKAFTRRVHHKIQGQEIQRW
jgi:hypothetical protein